MAVFSPRGGGSNNFDLTPSKKLTNHILLSSIVASLLFSPAFALPSGGKFTHGTSGTINVSGNNMHINGNKVNSVIQWGGGFNINKGESVNFGGNSKNYLNIAHGTNKSTIAGVLNASGNNVFLINPNGVIITKTGNINANRFVASTSSMDSKAMQEFANMKTFNDGLAFSPVFKPNPKGGNVINMGNINANDVTLQGNKVLLQAETSLDKDTNNIKLNQITTDNLTIKANEAYVDVATTKTNKINITANKGNAYLSATGYYYNPKRQYNEFNSINNKINKTYNQFISIGSDVDWWHFAKGWNESNDFRTIASEYRLINDINFNANCKNGICTGQNYANYWVDLNADGIKQDNEFTSMIVGEDYNSEFSKNFDGQGYTLKNINIDTTKLDNTYYAGIFGDARNATFKNINVDYMGGSVIGYYAAGFIASSSDSKFYNMKISNIGLIQARHRSGGFIADAYRGAYYNIHINNIKEISGKAASGGFVGFYSQPDSNYKDNVYFQDIYIDNINTIRDEDGHAGGFAGDLYSIYAGRTILKNIYINNINSIFASGDYGIYGGKDNTAKAGGFVGSIGLYGGGAYDIFNVSINNIGTIKSLGKITATGGFAGELLGGGAKFENISLNNIKNIISENNNKDSLGRSASSGGFAGYITGGYFNNISLNNIGTIKSIKTDTSHKEVGIYSGGFVGFLTYRANINNIFMFMDQGASILASGGSESLSGKFFGMIKEVSDFGINFSNINIYHHENDLTNATADQAYWKNNLINFNANINGEINIHTYTDKTQGYTDFKKQALTIDGLKEIDCDNGKKCLIFTTDFDIEKPTITSPIPNLDSILNEKPTLNKDDLISNAVWNDYIIKDIDKIKYVINIRLLDKLLKEYKTLANKTEDEQVKFITAYLGVKENDARALLQSLSFLNAYKDHDINKAQFENNAKKDFEQSFKKADDKIKDFNKNKNLWHTKLDKLNKEVVSLGLDIEKQLEQNQAKLKRFIKAYNEFLTLIDKGIKNENDPAFIAIKNNIKELDKEAKLLYAKLSIQENNLQIFKDKNNNNKVIVIGKFNTSLINTPNVDKPTQGGGIENDDYQKLSRQIASSQKQTPTFKYEEEETQEIEEAAITQRARTCIVSDNFKTMNPCVVGSY
ncbi:hemagglutinin domain-containing protein [Campylobacter peloridis LMG 23910]|uniref:two-partner secretion domain-containing protein n=1 Tax=Campylobacter peloridis TaxID=488546 RepID=UPI0005823060|nr:filamentous hemagglutinin N-terminal domain-containing protein [Campylobacter peloridis]AJC84853.1 hemagglutinin domain-containing protein [Campylobacter peloridis LMG 23910]